MKTLHETNDRKIEICKYCDHLLFIAKNLKIKYNSISYRNVTKLKKI